jgi:hypothetical protein
MAMYGLGKILGLTHTTTPVAEILVISEVKTFVKILV